MFVKFLRLFIAALWSTAGKGMTSWFLFVMFNSVLVTLLTHWKAFAQSEFLSPSVYSVWGMLQTVDNSKRCTTCKYIQCPLNFQYVC